MTGGEDLRLVMRHSPTSTSRDWSASLRTTRSPSSSETPPGGVPSAPLVDRAVPGGALHYVDCKKNAKKTNGVKDLDVYYVDDPRFRGLPGGTA